MFSVKTNSIKLKSMAILLKHLLKINEDLLYEVLCCDSTSYILNYKIIKITIQFAQLINMLFTFEN